MKLTILITLLSSAMLLSMNNKEYKTQINMESNTTNVKDTAIKAPELRVQQWIDKDGKATTPVKLADFEGKFKIIYCFQHWCPGCHSKGLPALKKMVDEFEGNDKIEFLAIQTVFEGGHTNTFDKLLETQNKYDLKIPFGHDVGETRSTVMEDYKTGGTPWFIFIDKDNNVLFADFHINVDGAIKYLKETL